MLDQLRAVVQGKPCLQIAKIAGRDLETLLLGDGAPPPQAPGRSVSLTIARKVGLRGTLPP